MPILRIGVGDASHIEWANCRPTIEVYTLSTSVKIVHACREVSKVFDRALLETWLQPNRRALWFGCIPPFLFGAVGAWLAASDWSGSSWLRWIGIALVVVAALAIAALVRQLRRPRIAFRNGEVLFYLRSGEPIAVPVDVIEAFFIGQGPAHLPAKIPQHAKSLNLVARLSRRAPNWAERDVKPALGQWSDGYVTIRGTWCEPLTVEVVRRLNRRLKEIQQSAGACEADDDQPRSSCSRNPC